MLSEPSFLELLHPVIKLRPGLLKDYLVGISVELLERELPSVSVVDINKRIPKLLPAVLEIVRITGLNCSLLSRRANAAAAHPSPTRDHLAYRCMGKKTGVRTAGWYVVEVVWIISRYGS